ncbi:MAG: VOC family protein [Deltaproteobacteria bacterium]|jgi:PhnB protein
MNVALTPRLVVQDADAALAFYGKAFGAEVLERYAEPDGHVVHAAFRIGDAVVSLTQEREVWGNAAPPTLGGSPVLLNVVVDDVDALVERFLAAGGEVVIALADQFYGHREGRFRDPFGHLWILTSIVEVLTPEQIEARMRG